MGIPATVVGAEELNNIQEEEELPSINEIKKEELRIPDKWILSRLNYLIKTVSESMENYDYLKASREIKNFYWNEFCDWYIEISKIRLYGEEEKDKVIPKVILLYILDTTYKLLHPIVPFVTEKLWQNLPSSIKSEPALIVAKWPEYDESFIDKKLEEEFQFSTELIHEIRRIRAAFNIGLTKKIPLQIKMDDTISQFDNTREEVVKLAKIDPERLIVSSELEQPKQAARVVIHGITAYIPLEEIINIEEERKKVLKRLNNITRNIDQIKVKLNSPFSQKAPVEVINKEKEKLMELEDKKTQIEEQLEILT